MQVDPNNPTLKAPGTKRLTLKYHEVLQSFAFKFNLRCYSKGEYTHMFRCTGHSATINHLDFSLPLFNPPELRGRTLIVSNCNSWGAGRAASRPPRHRLPSVLGFPRAIWSSTSVMIALPPHCLHC